MPRQSAKLDKDTLIDYDELLEASSMSGLLSFLELPHPTVNPSETRTKDPLPIDSLSAPGIVNLSTHAESVVCDIPVPNLSTPPMDKLSTPKAINPDQTPPRQPDYPPIDILTKGGFETIDGMVVEAKHVRPFENVQSAHTPTEHSVYTTMWKMLGSRGEEGTSREGIIALAEVARKVSISRRNIQRILQSLERKLAIEITGYEDGSNSIPRRYRIWGFSPTMDRRRQAGFTHVYRNRNFITLARPLNDLPGTPIDKVSTLASLAPIDNLAAGPVDKLAAKPIDKLSTFLSNKESKANGSSSSSPLPELRGRLHTETALHWDDAAVRSLWFAGLEKGIETVDELLCFVREKWGIVRERRMVNPIGLMLTAVPNLINAERLASLRQQIQESAGSDQDQDEAMKRWRQEQEQALSDPKLSDQERSVIRRCLDAANVH